MISVKKGALRHPVVVGAGAAALVSLLLTNAVAFFRGLESPWLLGSVIVADDRVSIPHMALRTARFYHHESCGKCTPCREGTNWTVKMLERVVRGEATPMDLDIVSSVQENIIGHCLCVLGDSMAMPVGAMVRKFRNEFEQVMAQAADTDRIAAVQGAPQTLGATT